MPTVQRTSRLLKKHTVTESLKSIHVLETKNTYFENRENGETVVVFLIAQLHNKRTRTYIMRICFLYGNIKQILTFF